MQRDNPLAVAPRTVHPRPRMTSRVLAVFCIAAAFTTHASGSSAAELDPYRALSRGKLGMHLLAVARETLEGRAARDPVDRDTASGVSGQNAAPQAGDSPASDPALPASPAALYVTLLNGSNTRACVGNDPPRGAGLEEAVRSLAEEALTGDRRRPPVRHDELDHLRIVIAFAAPLEAVPHANDVDPGREGLLIDSAEGRVAFLPGEARTVAWALREARRIGVLKGPSASARFYRFDVVTLSEAAPPAANRKDFDAVP